MSVHTAASAFQCDTSAPARNLPLTLRTYQRSPKPGHDWVESSFHYEAWSVTIATRAAAVVLVDVWDRHVITSHAARTSEISRTRIAPVLAAARTAGVAVIHAPSPVQARRYPQWARFASDADAAAPAISSWPFAEPDDPADANGWPPTSFRRREGPFAQFRRPSAALIDSPRTEREGRVIDPSVAPEPDDFVVATGDQLHRLCAAHGILHLFYAGFAANICIPYKDYGMRAFHARGYHTILLRDCTTAIEGHDTVDDQAGTRQAIRELEMAGIAATITSDEFVSACAQTNNGEQE